MINKKKIRKHHNIGKRTQLHAKAAASKYLIAWCMGEKEPTFFNLKGAKVTSPSDAVKIQIMSLPMPWTSMCIVMNRDHLGSDYLQSISITANAPYMYATLAHTLNVEHQALVDKAVPDHILGASWIANVSGRDVSDEVAYKIIRELGGWNIRARWEKLEQQKYALSVEV